ncbi:MAG: PP2C family protein-serine/threonine phosphatase [Hyphomicrobiales bacterium]
MTTAAFRFETGTATHTGKVREVNEDGLFANADWGVWVVADGMGGHENGRLASATIVEEVSTIGNAVSAPDLLARFRDRIFRANARLLKAADHKGPHVIIGSTVAAVLVYGGHYACVWSGDSRIYLVRGEEMQQVSRDHTEAQELVDHGSISPAEARNWPRRNVITRAIGIFDDPGLDLVQGELHAGDVFVVCSDGLTGPVEDAEIRHSIASHAPQEACDALIDMALERGASDNVTVIVVRCMADEPAMAAPVSGEAA